MRLLTELNEYRKENIWFCFLVFLSLLFSGLHHQIFSLIYNRPIKGFEVHVLFEVLMCLAIFASFYFWLCNRIWDFDTNAEDMKLRRIIKRLIKSNRWWNNFYKRNEFYCKLMVFTIVVIFLGNVHFLQTTTEIIIQQLITNKTPEIEIESKTIYAQIRDAVKVWEVAAYITTAIYHYWFWQHSKAGEDIQTEIASKGAKNWRLNVKIFSVVVFLIIISVIHIFILSENENNWWLSEYGGQISIFLIIIVYSLFIYNDRMVIFNGKTHKFKRDFIVGLRYIDRPILIIFCILFIYAVYTTATGHFHSIEIFFSGAIAFELLLSSIVWANTKTA